MASLTNMNNRNDTAHWIDWTDREEAMATYREYEKYSMTGPNFTYYNGRLLPVRPPSILDGSLICEYKVGRKPKNSPKNLK
jgi:hypothetical protein